MLSKANLSPTYPQPIPGFKTKKAYLDFAGAKSQMSQMTKKNSYIPD